VNRRVLFLVASVVTVVIAAGAVVSGFTSRDSGSTATPSSGTSGGGTPVAIEDFAFAPKSISVAAGGSVTWTNKDSTDHSIKSADNSFNSSDLGSGQTFTAKFTTPGTYAYVCGIHSFMTGTVVVTG